MHPFPRSILNKYSINQTIKWWCDFFHILSLLRVWLQKTQKLPLLFYFFFPKIKNALHVISSKLSLQHLMRMFLAAAGYWSRYLWQVLGPRTSPLVDIFPNLTTFWKLVMAECISTAMCPRSRGLYSSTDTITELQASLFYCVMCSAGLWMKDETLRHSGTVREGLSAYRLPKREISSKDHILKLSCSYNKEEVWRGRKIILQTCTVYLEEY